MSKTIRKRKSNIKKTFLSKKQNGGAARNANPSNTNNNSTIEQYITCINDKIDSMKLDEIKKALTTNLPNLLGINDSNGKLNKKCFTFEYIVPDKNLDNLLLDPYKWYLDTTNQYTSNTFVKSILDKNINVPQYINIVIGMVKDLLLVLCMKRMPGLNKKDIEQHPYLNNNKNPSFQGNENKISKELKNKQLADNDDLSKNAEKLLNDIELLIKAKIPYKKFTEIVFQYIVFFSSGVLEPIQNEICEDVKTTYDCIVKSPYILLPSFKQIDFKKVIDSCKAPIVNFRLINTRRVIHTSYGYPCTEAYHDIIFHAKQTHHNLETSGNLKKLFDDRNETFNKIQHLYDYTTKELHVPEQLIKYRNCCILFILIHEIAQIKEKRPPAYGPFYTEPYNIQNLIANLSKFKQILVEQPNFYEKLIKPNVNAFIRDGVTEDVLQLHTIDEFKSSIEDLIDKLLKVYLL